MKNTTKTTAPNVTEAAFHSLLRIWGLLRHVQEPYFAQFGITASQWAILRVLHKSESQGETGLSLKELGQRLYIQPPSVTSVVDRLERLGVVIRSHCQEDRRVYRASLTPQGRAMVNQVLTVHSDRIKSLFAAHKPQEQEVLLGLLMRLEAHLKEMSARQPLSAMLILDAEKV